ncbi:MAG: hypothetical protein R3E97_20310 [Candidatus Eisenbacteria bacterium]
MQTYVSRNVWSLGLLLVAIATLPSQSWASPLATGALLLPAGTVVMTVPDPPNVTVIPCDDLNGIVLAPDHPAPMPASQVEIIVRNSDNIPVVNAAVTVEFGASNVACPDAVYSATTDASGTAYLSLTGGGCAHQIALSGVIKANGITLRNYQNVKSPDFDGSGGDLQVNLADLIAFTGEFLGTDPPACHDYDNSGTTDLGDLVMFSPAFVDGSHCP